MAKLPRTDHDRDGLSRFPWARYNPNGRGRVMAVRSGRKAPHSGARRSQTARRLLLLGACAIVLFPTVAPATVAEQRSRLPPPAFCEDDVAGTWRSHYYFRRQRQWYIFTLEIKRVADQDDQLEGTILSHFWNGKAEEPEPPPCRPGLFRQIVKMPAKGHIRQGVVTFGGTSWTLDQTVCGNRHVYYNEDNFSGRIDPEIQEFQSVNNDRGAAVNVPVVFRRVKCPDEEKHDDEPNPDVKPPSFQPPTRKKSGCGCDLPFAPAGSSNAR